MFFKTKFFQYIIQLLNNFKGKVSIAQKTFSLVLLSLFIGFLFGNLFGTFLDTLRLYFVWNGFIGLFLLLFLELLNFLVYGISFSISSSGEALPRRGRKGVYAFQNQPNNFKYFKKDKSYPFGIQSVERSLYAKEVTSRDPFVANNDLRKFQVTADKPKSSEKLLTNIPDPLREQDIIKNSRNDRVLAKSCTFKIFSLNTSIFGKPLVPHLFSENSVYIKRIVNSFKIGLLFGFFVDSFKVGS